jgi:hypothetical protein
MPLRFRSDDAQPAEPIAAIRPPAVHFEESRPIRSSYPCEAQPEKGNLILKIVIGGIFAYVAFMAVGLCGVMFPRQSHDVVRAVNQAVALVRPDPPRPRMTLLESMPAATITPVKPAVSASHKHYRRAGSPEFGSVEVVDSNHTYLATPSPVTVSVDASEPTAQPAN